MNYIHCTVKNSITTKQHEILGIITNHHKIDVHPHPRVAGIRMILSLNRCNSRSCWITTAHLNMAGNFHHATSFAQYRSKNLAIVVPQNSHHSPENHASLAWKTHISGFPTLGERELEDPGLLSSGLRESHNNSLSS